MYRKEDINEVGTKKAFLILFIVKGLIVLSKVLAVAEVLYFNKEMLPLECNS